MLNILYFILFKIFYNQEINIDIQGRQFALTYIEVGSSLIEMPIIFLDLFYFLLCREFQVINLVNILCRIILEVLLFLLRQ